MKIQKYAGFLFPVVLALAILICGAMPVSVEAKTNKVSVGNSSIGINGKTAIRLPDSGPAGATYTYTSSNPSVASVNKKGFVTGKKVGSTYIRTTQHYKGKKKSLNSIKITVKAAYISSPFKTYTVSTQPGRYEQSSDDFYVAPNEDQHYLISCGNLKAVYKYYSSNPKKVKVASSGHITSVNGKNGDKVKITVKETYQKKTKTVGTFTVVLKDPKLTKSSVTWYTGHHYYTDNLISNCGTHLLYIADQPLDEEKIAEIGEAKTSDSLTSDTAFEFPYGGSDHIKITDSGTRYFYFYPYNFKTKQYEYIGSYVTVHLVKAELKSLELKDVTEPVQLVENGQVQYVNFIPNPHSDQFDLERLSIKSSDPEIVSAFLTQAQCLPDHPLSRVSLYPKKAGTATITIEADGVKKDFTVIVNPKL